jgi:hypothetical protein
LELFYACTCTHWRPACACTYPKLVMFVHVPARIKSWACFCICLLLLRDECVSACTSAENKSFFHDSQIVVDSASLFLLATMRTLEDKITSARMYSCSFDSIQRACEIADTFYWINYTYSHELRCECTPTRTKYTTSSASGTWSRVSLCCPLYTMNIFYGPWRSLINTLPWNLTSP